jgi:hypothetical protein
VGRRGYPPEFRRKVLDLVASGRKVAQVAFDLEISEQPLDTVPAAPDLVVEVPGVGEDGANGGGLPAVLQPVGLRLGPCADGQGRPSVFSRAAIGRSPVPPT